MDSKALVCLHYNTKRQATTRKEGTEVLLLAFLRSRPLILPSSPCPTAPSSLVVQRSVRLPSSLVSPGLTHPATHAHDRQAQFKGLLMHGRASAGWGQDAEEIKPRPLIPLPSPPPSFFALLSPLPHVLTLSSTHNTPAPTHRKYRSAAFTQEPWYVQRRRFGRGLGWDRGTTA